MERELDGGWLAMPRARIQPSYPSARKIYELQLPRVRQAAWMIAEVLVGPCSRSSPVVARPRRPCRAL
eukprot:2356257-Pyramimonas_sp.AAC.1